MLGALPMATSAAYCGVEFLPTTIELNDYSTQSKTVENSYQTVDKLYAHGVTDASTVQRFYLARDAWNSTYKTYQDSSQRFSNEIKSARNALSLVGINSQIFKDQCSVAESESKTFVQVQLQLRSQTNNILDAMSHFDDRQPITNDALSSQQYYLKFTNVDGAKIAISPSPIIVAVVDDGIYVNHKDLIENIWINSREVIGNKKDDDGNGYVDDIYGYDFIGATPEMTVRGSHGTHVAGIIGAVNNRPVVN